MQLKTLIITSLSLICGTALADDPFYRNASDLGRGNNSVAWDSSNRVSQFFNNPSLLENKDSFSLELVNPTVDFSSNLIPTLNHPPQYRQGHVNEDFSPYFGETISGYASVYPAVSYKGFVLIPYSNSFHGSASLENPVFSELNAYYYRDYTSGLAKGYRLTDNISMGASAFYTHREAAVGSLNVLSILNKNYQSHYSGSAVSLNLGSKYEFLDSRKTLVGVDLKNIGSPQFWDSQLTPNQPKSLSKLDQELNLGISTNPFVSDLLRFGLEIKKATSDEDIGSKVAVGSEVSPLTWLKLRTGLYEEYVTYGVGFNFNYFGIDFSSYGEAPRNTTKDQIRHYVFDVKFGFNL